MISSRGLTDGSSSAIFVRMLTGQPQGLIPLCLWTWHYCRGSGLLNRLLSLRKWGSDWPPLTVPVSASSRLFWFTDLLDVEGQSSPAESMLPAVWICVTPEAAAAVATVLCLCAASKAPALFWGPGSHCTEEISQLVVSFSAFPFPHPQTATSRVK